MKTFVFNFTSCNKDKLLEGEELYNLISTCLAFEQNVILIAEENSFPSLDANNLEIVRPDDANKFIDKSDFYLEC